MFCAIAVWRRPFTDPHRAAISEMTGVQSASHNITIVTDTNTSTIVSLLNGIRGENAYVKYSEIVGCNP